MLDGLSFFLLLDIVFATVIGDAGAFRCPSNQFKCKTMAMCIEQKDVCNNVNDCRDGTDEKLCYDHHQDDIWNLAYPKRPDADQESKIQECDMQSIPMNCLCHAGTQLSCNSAGYKTFPVEIPTEVTFLDISGNDISNLRQLGLHNLSNLQSLIVRHNKLTIIENGTFHHNMQLKKLDLVSNRIQDIRLQAFPVDNVLTELNLDHNFLHSLTPAQFYLLRNLKILYARENRIQYIEPGTFSGTPNLQILFLSGNLLSRLDSRYFEDLHQLQHLHLGENHIITIAKNSFMALHQLESIILTANRIRVLTDATFLGLGNVTYMDIRDNEIVTIHQKTFLPLTKLKSLDMRKNRFRELPFKTFNGLQSVDVVYFDEFYMCASTPGVKLCEPFTDGISSKENLLENIFLRIMVWIVALLSCLGNTIVLFGRFFLKEDNQVHSFYIKSLSLADMCMGIYLLILGSRDLSYRGIYLYFDKEWRSSNECILCGVLSTLSNEVSVLTLAIITLDRFIGILYPLHCRQKNFRCAYITIFVAWFISLNLTVLPIIGIDYFGTSFYGDNSVCVPLHLHKPSVHGWEYSTFLFLGINLTAFSFICYAYIHMFLAIRRSTNTVRSHFENHERKLAKRFFFIVLTDFICWAPVMVVKFLAVTGNPISGSLYGWLVVFILPVNSAINPLLYTITTKMFREKILVHICYQNVLHCLRTQSLHTPSSSSSSSSSIKRCNSTRYTLEKDLCEVGGRTLNCASKIKNSYILKTEAKKKNKTGKYLCFDTRQMNSRQLKYKKPISHDTNATDYIPMENIK